MTMFARGSSIKFGCHGQRGRCGDRVGRAERRATSATADCAGRATQSQARRAASAVVILMLALCGAAPAFATTDGAASATFADRVDLKPLGTLAVNNAGRVKSLDSHASAVMQMVTGSYRIDGHSPAFTYLDLMIRPDEYTDVEVIYVKNKPVRAEIADALDRSLTERVEAMKGSAGEAGQAKLAEAEVRIRERIAKFMKTGLVSEAMLLDDARVKQRLQQLSTNLVTTAKPVEQIQSALNIKSPGFLRENLKLIPPASGKDTDPWLTMDDVVTAVTAKRDIGIDPALAADLTTSWRGFEDAWGAQDADAANAAIAKFVQAVGAQAQTVARVNPSLYPSQRRLALESWYFMAGNMTWVWMIYLAAVIPLLVSVVYRWPAARWLGIGMFIVAFGFHTFALLLRWYVSDRWPNSNMFEAVTTSAWFGGCAALILETITRRTAMRNWFALGSAVASMVALMCAHFMPLQLDANINNRMPVLHDVWLYIHTNVVIFSYCLIFMAAVVALAQLVYRAFGGAVDYARGGGAGSLIAAAPGVGGILAGGAGGAGGAGFGAGGGAAAARVQSSVAVVLDGVTMVLLELAFIMLWSGLVMGAIWADHSWGRPWGWDPKEVFALNTFIIFLLLVHVRLKVRDKGFWTAILAVIGAGVMIFNWIIINFTISGLHSYA